MSMRRKLCWSVMILAATALVAPVAEAQLVEFEVRVTNLTSNQIFSPPLFLVSDAGDRIFTPGRKASPGLALLAEEGDQSLLFEEVAGPGALVQGMDEVILPGTTASVRLFVDPSKRLGLAAMLVTTNDAFLGVDSFRLDSVPIDGRTVFYAYAWDAGSEANTESCADIPGPPCGGAGRPAGAGAERFIHIHSGIRGDADVPRTYSWLNPVARIVVVYAGLDPEGEG